MLVIVRADIKNMKITIYQVTDRNLTTNKAVRQLNKLRTEFPEAQIGIYQSLRENTEFSVQILGETVPAETRKRIAKILK